MKNELTSNFEKVIYYISKLNKNNLIKIYKILDNSFDYNLLKTKKNHELKYGIYLKVIKNIDLMNKVIDKSVNILIEKEIT